MATGTQQGYLIIADISGYTAYLTGVELEHAQGILTRLIQSILDAFKPPIELVELEGDAVYVYLPGVDADGDTVLGAIEDAYFAFARQREIMAEVEPCICQACRELPTLDLKFVVHFGEFVVQRLAGRVKPIGPDVILVHRLLKNQIAEAMGLRAYVLFTDAALARLGLDATGLGLRAHVEEYEHLGRVSGAVHDLIARWAETRSRQLLRLDAERARAQHAVELPAPPEVIWAYLTRSVYRERWNPGEARAAAAQPAGAEHGPTGGPTIVDWQPYAYFTTRQAMDAPFRPEVVLTTELAPTAVGTRVSWFCAPSAGLRSSLGMLLGKGSLRAGGDRLERLVSAEWPPPTMEQPPDRPG